jgi:FkbM family methyltransferase
MFKLKIKKTAEIILEKIPVFGELIINLYTQSQIKKVVNIFQKKDFEIKEKNNIYYLSFNNALNCMKSGYSPSFFYNIKQKFWSVNFNDINVFAKTNPCFELINEIRGYTLLENIDKDDIVVDVGCSSGFISCYFAKKVGENGKIISLEFEPEAIKTFKQNITKNCLDNIILVEKALFVNNDGVSIELVDFGGSKICDNGNNKTVASTTLNNLFNELDIDKTRVKLIKMDIEGAEVDIIDDILGFIENEPQCIAVIASYHKKDNDFSYKIIEEKAKASNKLYVRTVYPYHTTTYIINKQNNLMQKLESYPIAHLS